MKEVHLSLIQGGSDKQCIEYYLGIYLMSKCVLCTINTKHSQVKICYHSFSLIVGKSCLFIIHIHLVLGMGF